MFDRDAAVIVPPVAAAAIHEITARTTKRMSKILKELMGSFFLSLLSHGSPLSWESTRATLSVSPARMLPPRATSPEEGD